MYQKQILMEKLKEATASVLPISLIVMAISFVLVPVDAGLMLSFVIATAMLILGMGFFTLGADMSMSRIGNYMGSKLTKSRKLPLILTVSFALGVAITVAEPDLQVLAGNVPEIDTTVLILTVSVGVGFFLMLCMVRILFSISLRTMLIVFYAIVFAAAFLSDESILSVAFDSGGVTTGPMTVPFIMALGVGVASIRSDENAKADSFGLVGLCSIGPILSVLLLGAIYKTQPAQGESSAVSGVATTVELGKDYLHALPEYLWEVTMALLPIVVFFLIFQVISLKLRKLPFMRIVIGILYTYLGLVLFLTGVNVGFSSLGAELGAALKNVIALCAGITDGLGFGDNAKAMLMTRGLTEMARLGVSLGAHKDTLAGLSGIGDLIVTCTSLHSRNNRAGILIGSGKTPQEAMAEVGAVVEGYYATKSAWELCQKQQVDMPIIHAAYQVLYENADARKTVAALLTRQRRAESEDVGWI